jgi:hypothetical protein
MSIKDLWNTLANVLQYVNHQDSRFFKDNYKQIVGDAKLGSLEQQERLFQYTETIRVVMRDIQEAIRLEPRPEPVEKPTFETQPRKQASPSPPRQPHKRKADSPPPKPKKQAPQLLGELMALGVETATACQQLIEKPHVGFADQKVQCLADIKHLEKDDANAMLRLIGIKNAQITKILNAVFSA